MKEYEASGVGDQQFSLVSPAWVAEHVNDEDLCLLDVRSDVHAYFAGHVPNAVHLADTTMRGPVNGLPVQYLAPAAMAELLAQAGVTNKRKIVVYSDGEDVLGATMVAYCLERLGHKGVMLLDGGYAAFAATQKTTQEYPKYTPGKFTPKFDPSIFVTLDELKKIMGKKEATIIDSRPPPAYRGEVKTWMRNGHIPGAINIDWHTLVDSSNPHKVKDQGEIAKLFESRGVTKDKDIIVSCGTSREATLEYHYLKHVLGYPKVRLYEGSWNEYSSHPELEIER